MNLVAKLFFVFCLLGLYNTCKSCKINANPTRPRLVKQKTYEVCKEACMYAQAGIGFPRGKGESFPPLKYAFGKITDFCDKDCQEFVTNNAFLVHICKTKPFLFFSVLNRTYLQCRNLSLYCSRKTAKSSRFWATRRQNSYWRIDDGFLVIKLIFS